MSHPSLLGAVEFGGGAAAFTGAAAVVGDAAGVAGVAAAAHGHVQSLAVAKAVGQDMGGADCAALGGVQGGRAREAVADQVVAGAAGQFTGLFFGAGQQERVLAVEVAGDRGPAGLFGCFLGGAAAQPAVLFVFGADGDVPGAQPSAGAARLWARCRGTGPCCGRGSRRRRPGRCARSGRWSGRSPPPCPRRARSLPSR
jgi:hypothetical protein